MIPFAILHKRGPHPNTAGPILVPVATVVIEDTTPINVTAGTTFTARAHVFDANNNELFGRVIIWSSNDATKATIDANTGLITGVAAGTPTMTATCESQTDTTSVVVTSPINTVTQVTLSISSASIFTGGLQQVTATPKDVSGNAVIGRTVTWTRVSGTSATIGADSGADPHVATITADPTITGVSVFKATCDGVDSTGNVTITVSVQSSGGTYDNMPAGSTVLATNSFTTLASPSPWLDWGAGSPSKIVVTDASIFPLSGNTGWRVKYAAGTTGGSSVSNTAIPTNKVKAAGWYRMYCGFTCMYSSNWFTNISGLQKLIYFAYTGNAANGAPSGKIIIAAEAAGQSATAPMSLSIRMQDCDPSGPHGISFNFSSIGAYNTGASRLITRGVPFSFEAEAACNTPGVADGTLKLWLNGVLVQSATNMQYNSVAQAAGNNNNFHDTGFIAVYGGGANTTPVPSDQYIYADELKVAGRDT